MKDVNSCPPGTPWKASPVSVPSAFRTRTQGSSASGSPVPVLTVRLSVTSASSVM